MKSHHILLGIVLLIAGYLIGAKWPGIAKTVGALSTSS